MAGAETDATSFVTEVQRRLRPICCIESNNEVIKGFDYGSTRLLNWHRTDNICHLIKQSSLGMGSAHDCREDKTDSNAHMDWINQACTLDTI